MRPSGRTTTEAFGAELRGAAWFRYRAWLEEDLLARPVPQQRMLRDTRLVLNCLCPSPDGRRVLWGGRASFAAESAEQAAPRLHATMCEVFPELREVKITHAWTGNVAFTFDHLPISACRMGCIMPAAARARAWPWPPGSAIMWR